MPAPRPSPLPPPPPILTAPPSDWQSGPLSPGDWTYSPSATAPLAGFESDRASLVIRCRQDRSISLSVTGVRGNALVIRTSYGMRRLAANDPDQSAVVAILPASDAMLDQMAFSRGRFLVTLEGGPSLVVPAWPEIGRVIEDCRG